MIERLLRIKSPISAIVSYLSRTPNCLNTNEWEILLDLIHILKPFEIMIAELSEENYPTLSIVIPLISGLRHILRNLNTETEIGDAFRNTLIDVISR